MNPNPIVNRTNSGWHWKIDADDAVYSGVCATREEAEAEGRRVAWEVWSTVPKIDPAAGLRADLAIAVARAEAAERDVEAWRTFALEVALQVAPLGEEHRAAQTTVRDLPAVAEALREVVAERDRADQRADRAHGYKVAAENEAAALRARAEAAEVKAKQAADDHDFLARQIGAAAVASTLAPGESLVREPGETRHVIVGVVERLVARAHTAEATAARLNAANVRLMRRLGPALGAWKAAADIVAQLRQEREAAEAALATARAEGAAAERAAIVAMLRVDLGDLENVNDAADDFVRDLIEDIEGGVHVRPAEGA
jgi:hypothetical protein